jgi:ATP-dependent DNA helicase DinG
VTPADVLGPGGRLAKAFPGYEHRPGQLDMAARIARALDEDERLLVEAGTGTGKTLAYLVPAILSGRKVVVTTATKTLQDQIARVDLPRLAQVMPRPFTWSVMKGLGNYVCRRRLALYEQQTTLVADPAFDRLRAWIDESASGAGEVSDAAQHGHSEHASTRPASSRKRPGGSRTPPRKRTFTNSSRTPSSRSSRNSCRHFPNEPLRSACIWRFEWSSNK